MMQSTFDPSYLTALLSSSIGSASSGFPQQSNDLSNFLARQQVQPSIGSDSLRGSESLFQRMQQQNTVDQRLILLSQQLAAIEGDGGGRMRSLSSIGSCDHQNAAALLLLHQHQVQQQEQIRQQKLQQLRAVLELQRTNSLYSALNVGSLLRSSSSPGGSSTLKHAVNQLDSEVKSIPNDVQLQTTSSLYSTLNVGSPISTSESSARHKSSAVDSAKKLDVNVKSSPFDLEKEKVEIKPSFTVKTTNQALLGSPTRPAAARKGKGRTCRFPQKLYQMLLFLETEGGGSDIASFLADGCAFAIHKPRDFANLIMPKYFRMSRFSSFQRQLNLYDFQRITTGNDKGAYYHELFRKGDSTLCNRMKRNKIKGIKDIAKSVEVQKHEGASIDESGDDDDISTEE